MIIFNSIYFSVTRFTYCKLGIDHGDSKTKVVNFKKLGVGSEPSTFFKRFIYFARLYTRNVINDSSIDLSHRASAPFYKVKYVDMN